jgi:hypothetical protein
MLAYRHAFHAGNHADVLKHLTLVQVLLHLNQKAKGYRVIDTHAGAGGYALSGRHAQQHREFDGGIAPAVGPRRPAGAVQAYVDQVRSLQRRPRAAPLPGLAGAGAAADAPAGPAAPVRAARHRPRPAGRAHARRRRRRGQAGRRLHGAEGAAAAAHAPRRCC